MGNYTYQYGFSRAHSAKMYDQEMRGNKVRKMLAVLDDHFRGKLEGLCGLDIGCSTGIISNGLSQRFRRVLGTDIDKQAVQYAHENFHSDNLRFFIQDSMNPGFSDKTFDVVVCAHIYEHVPDSKRLLTEIHRLLKQGGICFFAAGNRLSLIEPHYKLPLLSVIPKPWAHFYLRVLKKGSFYYEKHLTLPGLRKLVCEFEVIDYTREIIRDPVKYKATEMIENGSFKQKAAILILRIAYWLCPTYIWLLRKR